MRSARLAALLAVALSPLALAACGTEGIELAAADQGDEQLRLGAVVFEQKCSGCHSLDAAGAQGSATDANKRENKDGPNFDQRLEEVDQVLYAIRNGGYSSGPMPQNIVVGEEAQAVAEFVAKYSGSEVGRSPTPATPGPTGAQGQQSPLETPETP